MNDLKQRNYYKIFANTDETDEKGKLNFGYEASTSEVIFKKDHATAFHMPFFTNIQKLSAGEIVASGAIPGPIPIMADRIFKKQGRYPNTTPWGATNDIPNGTWLCSWLYSLSGETPKWLDRFYNPGKISYTEALLGDVDSVTYSNNNPVYIDIPSTLTLEPGVLYQYFHHGEKTATDIVNTFSGTLSDRLRLNIQTWSDNFIDETIYNNKVYIKNFKTNWVQNLQEPEVNDRNVLSFKNNDFIDTRVFYNDSYNLKNEFTINFWAQNENWLDAPATQLVGNLNYGGYSVFFNNLKYYPFFVIPETYYGHLFYYNQEGFNFLDKSTQPVAVELTASSLSSPKQIGINGENEILVLDTGGMNSFYKMNHLGDILAVPRLSSEGSFVITGEPERFIIDKDNNCLFQTDEKLYQFDSNLVFLGASSIPYRQNGYFSIADINFKYNTAVKIVPGLYTALHPNNDITTNPSGSGAVLEISVNSLSAIDKIRIVNGGINYQENQLIRISNTVFLNNTAPLTTVNLSATISLISYGGQFVFDTDGNFILDKPYKDVKFDNNNKKWVIDNSGYLYCNNIQLTAFENCTNLAVDPANTLWVLYNKNSITKINTTTQEIEKNFNVGLEDSIDIPEKNISFIYSYDRTKNTKDWYALIYNNYDKTLYQTTLNGTIIKTSFLPDNTNVEQSPPELQDKSAMQFNSKGDFTGYEWKRIFNKVLYNNNPQIQFKIAAKKPVRSSFLKTFTVSVPVQYLTNKAWHLITGTFKNRTLSLYINTALRDKLVLPGNYSVNYLRKNDLFIGTPTGKFANLNTEINSKALIFDGYIDNIRIYDYAIEPSFLNMFLRSQYIGEDLYWNIPTTPIQYIEQVERFFKHKAPGSKSIFFKIKISGSEVTDINTRNVIESAIKSSIQQIKPAYSELIAVEWV